MFGIRVARKQSSLSDETHRDESHQRLATVGWTPATHLITIMDSLHERLRHRKNLQGESISSSWQTEVDFHMYVRVDGGLTVLQHWKDK